MLLDKKCGRSITFRFVKNMDVKKLENKNKSGTELS